MSIMNELLADIVVASGGTVRDPNNRNKLLEDWYFALGGEYPQELVALQSSDAVYLISSDNVPLEAVQ